MKPCPVCKLKTGAPLPELCPRCGWELKTDITLVPSIDLPVEAVNAYERRLEAARKIWTDRLELKAALDKSLAEKRAQDERLGRIEAMQMELMAALEKTREEKASLESKVREAIRKKAQKAAEKEKPAAPAEGKEWREPVTGMVFVYAPGGVLEMGDTFGDGFDDEQPVHKVELDSFYIGKHPVTQGQWKKVMGDNPSTIQEGDDHPVETVSWNDAKLFINKLMEMNRMAYEFTLPTEAQWEYAARSGGKQERYAGGNNEDMVAWYDGNSQGTTQPVGRKRANGLGIYDMSGNVWEWCWDIYDSDAYGKHQEKNPIYTVGGSDRVLRGGSWYDDADYARCAYRYHDDPASRDDDIGFRLARTI